MFSYEELLSKYNILLKENKELKSRVTELKTKLGMPIETEEVVVETSDTVINKYSSTTEKILLYRSLFCGREDVFARRWYSKTTEKSGYQPVCENEWADGLCDKRKYKCSVCPNRKLSPLTDKDIYKHLEGKDYYGKDVIGIYPMLVDETCHFLCADFDDKEYEKDVLAFCEICDELNIPAYIERSRSGGGAHIWVFFEVPIPAATARKLGSLILTKAMENRSELSFSSYDRLFPNQDNMPNGGFGNLIALPLQGQARKNDNSVFVDRNFKAYSDQWAYLSSIKKVSIKSIERIVETYSKNDVLGTLVDDNADKPWETKQKTLLTSMDFPDKLEIVRSNMIYIPREGLSANAQNQIKRLAAFKNPDFYKSQAMRLPIYDKPRIICTADITDSYIGLPRGCEPALCDILVDKVKNIDIIDKTNAGENIPVEFNGNLREEQELAVNELLKDNIGVLSATTAFGKTVIASYLAGIRKTNTLVLVHTQALMQQWKKSLEHYLIPRFTSFRNIADDNITALYKKLSDDAMRNNLIVNDVVAAIKNGRTPIILSERREHVTMLTELLKPHCDNVIEIVGTTSAKSRRETLERLDNIPQEESLVVVATGRYVGEGFDYPRLDTLFLALPIAWKGKVAQYAGRLHRNYQGKTEVQVYDYIDIHVPVLERMYQKRVKSYSAIGYKTKITTSSNASPDLIYDGKTFYPVFCRDIEITQNEILIVSPFMRKARLTQMLKVLSPLIMNKVTVTVVTRPPEDFKDKNKQIVIECTEQLKQYGIKVVYKSDFHQKFAIIDQSVVWYGSVNFLSFGTHEESIMRFENSDVAHQLMDTIL